MEYVSYLASVTILWFTNFPTKITNQQIFFHKIWELTWHRLKYMVIQVAFVLIKVKIYLNKHNLKT
jgi:hypothetical protein